MIRAFWLIPALMLLCTARLAAQCTATVQHANSNDQCLYAIENVVWQNLVNASASGNNITVSGTNNEVFDAGGLSVNTVKNNGWVTMVIDETNTERIFGLSNAPSTTPGFSRAQFGFYLMSGGAFRIYESGNYRWGDGTYAQNDVFKIIVEQSVVKYYQNSTLIYTSALTPTTPLVVDVTLKRKNTATPAATIKQVKVYNGSDGVFSASVSGAGAGSGASYQWYLNGATVGTNSSSYTNTALTSTDNLYCQITAGTGGCAASGTILTSNTVAFTNQAASTFGTYYALNTPAAAACLEAKESAVFLSLVNAVASGNDVTKTKGNTSLSDASAFSANSIQNNGYAEATIAEIGSNRVFGLSATNSGVSYTTIQYAIAVRGDGTLDVYESGTFKSGNIASYSSGTVLRIAIENNIVKYYVNGVLEYISTVTPTLPMYVDLAFTTLSGTLNDIVVVNGSTGLFTASGTQLGASPVYEWKVNGASTGVTTSTYSNSALVDNDVVTVDITNGLVGCAAVPAQTFDLQSIPYQGTFYIASNGASAACIETRDEVTFTNIINAIATGNDIVKFGDYLTDAYNSGAVSINNVYNNGHAEMTITQNNTARAFGLSTSNSNATKESILYGIELQGNGFLHVFEGNSDRGAYTMYNIGDVIKVAVENNVVKYYLNTTLLYTSAITPATLPMVVDVALQNRSPASRIDDVFVRNGMSGTFTAITSGAGVSPHYQWTKNGSNVGTNAATYTEASLTATDVIACKMRPDLAGCSTSEFTSNSIVVMTVAGASSPLTTWNGATSTDWFTSTNWSNGIPRGYTKVTIPVTGSGRYPQITTSSPQASAYDLTINAGAQVTITSTNTLDIFDNLSNSGTFSTNTSTVTLRGCTNNKNIVIASNPQTFHNLSVSNTNGVELNGEFHIKGQGTLTTGIIDYQTASSVLIFDDNATVANASAVSFVRGKVRKDGNDAFIFPIGVGSLYKPLTITAPSVIDEFTASYVYSSSAGIGTARASSIKTLSGCEYWSLTHPNGAMTKVTLSWNSGDCLPASEYVTDPTYLLVSYWDGSKWTDSGQDNVTGTAASGEVRSNTLASSGYFTLASNNFVNPLPVELADLKAETQRASVEVLWKTYSENDTHVFEVERADSTLQFSSIGTINAAGTSKQTLSYAFDDITPSQGLNYYRIKTVDLNGKAEYSRIVAAKYESENGLVLYPNPVKQGEQIHITRKQRLVIIDPLKGTLIMDVSNQSFIPTTQLKPGVYFAVDGSNTHNRFIVY